MAIRSIEQLIEVYRDGLHLMVDMELDGEQAKCAKWIVDDVLAHERVIPLEVLEQLIENSKEDEEGLV